MAIASGPALWGIVNRAEGIPLLRITPAPSRAAPVCEWIIKDPAAGTPDPVSGDARPKTARPPTKWTIRPPTPRNPSAAPLARGTGYSTPVTVPTIGHWMIARTNTIPYLDYTRSRTRAWPHGQSQRTGRRCYRRG